MHGSTWDAGGPGTRSGALRRPNPWPAWGSRRRKDGRREPHAARRRTDPGSGAVRHQRLGQLGNKADLGVVVHRDPIKDPLATEMYVRKVRFEQVGNFGVVTLCYDRATGRFSESAPEARAGAARAYPDHGRDGTEGGPVSRMQCAKGISGVRSP